MAVRIKMERSGKCGDTGDSPVHVKILTPSGILSSAGHEKSCVNLPGPSGKAKYSPETDSEPVP